MHCANIHALYLLKKKTLLPPPPTRCDVRSSVTLSLDQQWLISKFSGKTHLEFSLSPMSAPLSLSPLRPLVLTRVKGDDKSTHLSLLCHRGVVCCKNISNNQSSLNTHTSDECWQAGSDIWLCYHKYLVSQSHGADFNTWSLGKGCAQHSDRACGRGYLKALRCWLQQSPSAFFSKKVWKCSASC